MIELYNFFFEGESNMKKIIIILEQNFESGKEDKVWEKVVSKEQYPNTLLSGVGA